MSPERRQRIRDVFATVADMSPEERERALQESCAGDAEVRSGVESLLERLDDLGGRGGSEPLLAVGELVADRFKVLRAVGSGGMGEVYQCEDVELGQPIALKALRPNAAGSDAADRFKREIQIARSVAHPNVCRVYEYGHHTTDSGSIDFFTMEYVEGETLNGYLDRVGPLSPGQAQPLVRQIAAGLEALHDCGVVHRDLKPGNILLHTKPNGRIRVVLTDFGIAGLMGEQNAFGSFATVSGQVMGTPQYMAPEQLTGLAAGPSTDLFAFGIVLYEMLTGEQPFPDQNRRTDPPQPPSKHNEEVTPDWDRLVLSCLDLDISKRPNSVDAVFEVVGGPTKSFDPTNAKTVALEVQPRPRQWLRWVVPALLLSGLIIALLPVIPIIPDAFGEKPAIEGGRRVAVLPFVLAAGGPDLQALAKGLTDTVTGRLSQYESRNEELLVVPAAEVRKVGVESADKAGGALGVNYVVVGQMSAQDDRIRLTLTLIDAERMVQRETAVINGFRSKALDLEDEAVTRLATLLDLQALPTQVDTIAAVAPGAQEFYLQGMGYIQRSDELESVNNAIQLFEKAIALDPSYARAYAGLSRAYLYKRDRTEDSTWVEKAAEAAEKAVKLRPDLIEAQIARGYALAAQGQADGAVEFFNAALQLNPRSAEAYAGLGKAYESLAEEIDSEVEKGEQRNAAEAAYRKAISLRPNDWVTYKRLGLFYAGLDRYEDAIAQYEIVAELAPDNAHAFVNLGVWAHLTGDDTRAGRYLEKALEIDPNRTSAMTNLALLKTQEGDYRGAMALYEQAIERNPDSHSTWASLGGTYTKLGRREEADAAYRKAIKLLQKRAEIEGYSPSIHAALAHHFASIGDLPAARRQADQGRSSDDGQAQLNLAIAYSELGEKEAAVEALRRVVASGRPLEGLEGVDALRDILPRIRP